MPTRLITQLGLHHPAINADAWRDWLDSGMASSGMGGLMHPLKTSLGRLRIVGWWEGVSFLLLLGIAMPLKYLAGWPQAVRVVGMAHGVLFVLYVIVALHAAVQHRWTWRRTALVLAASVLPAGPFIVDARILREEAARENSLRV